MEGCDYEVFLSFRGPDMRTGFTDHLYTRLTDAGVRTYRGDEDLREGEEIGPDLLGAIEQSKISVPIFSKSYASSKWCLKELAQMVECRKRKGQIIMPIFYYVEPSEVRYQTGGYGEALLVHENKKRVDDESIRKWRAALNEVGRLKGWDIENVANSRHEVQLIKEVVTKVLSELKKAYLVVSDFLVGVDDYVKEVEGMIASNSDDVKIVGIHGMGGIGKTTLAKVVYNNFSRDFADCCFLADVRETSLSKGIEFLQTQLISNLSKKAHPGINSKDEGIMTVEERFSSKKFLILLDDVDEKDQLTTLLGRQSRFGMGSLILITTRKVNVLREFGVKLIYLVGGLGLERSLQLFSMHVFRSDHPPIEKMEQSREIVKIAEGLPLTLEVMGSTLSICGQRKEMWDDYLVKWKKGHIEGIGSKLKISYEELDSNQRQIFLDIACLFHEYDKNTVIYMWRDCGLCPIQSLEVLQLMSLIKIGEDNKLWMHDQLKDLGREIVSQESGGELDKQSRLWNHNDALEMLLKEKRNAKLEAVCLEFEDWSEYHSTLAGFAVLPKLRFLHVDSKRLSFERVESFFSQATLFRCNMPFITSRTDFSLSENQLLPNLRWLSWHSFPWWILKLSKFSLSNLVILDFSGSKLTHDWDGWRHIKRAKKLKVLNLSRCECLSKTPDFSGLLTLERLILEGCHELAEIDSSIGQLKHLEYLNLNNCDSLYHLPKELGTLPPLTELLLDGTSIERLPDWWGIENMESPHVHISPLEKAGDSLNCLTSPLKLSLNGTDITHRPDSIGVPTNLESLSSSTFSRDHGKKINYRNFDRKVEYVFEDRIDNIWSNSDELINLNSLPDGGIGWRKIGKIHVSRKEIGKGSNGTIVLEGIYEGRPVAVKRLVRGHCDVASNEIQILMASDRHKNIVRYHGVEYDPDFVYLALERCACSLDDLIQVLSDSSNNSAFPGDPASTDDYKIKLDSVRGMMQDVNLWQADGYPSPLLQKLMRHVVKGLSHLHDLRIIHRDLKPQNVLITKNPQFCAHLSDMGINKPLLEDKSSLGYHATGCGTSGWRAPELLRHGGHQTRAMDLFSLGCVLSFCFTRGRHPFGEILDRDHNIANNIMDLSFVNIPEARDLFSRLLNQDPKLRPKVSEVLRHPFFLEFEDETDLSS